MKAFALPEKLFHGTTYNFDKAKPGPYDKIFWTANSSTVAQNYIPESSSRIHTGTLLPGELKNSVRPNENDCYFSIALDMGFKLKNVEYDYMGRASRWAFEGDSPKYSDIVNYIEKNLGYKNDLENGYKFELKTSSWNSEIKQSKIEKSDFKLPGFLMLVTGHEKMKFYDMSQHEGDLIDPQYHKLGLFRKLEEEGWDGVIINDFAQSKNWGNVEHLAFGFFNNSVDKINIIKIPAVNFDWSDNLSLTETEEYLAYSRSLLAKGNFKKSISSDLKP